MENNSLFYRTVAFSLFFFNFSYILLGQIEIPPQPSIIQHAAKEMHYHQQNKCREPDSRIINSIPDDLSSGVVSQDKPGPLAKDSYCGAYAVWHLVTYYKGKIAIEDTITNLMIRERGYCTINDIVDLLASFDIIANVAQITSDKIASIDQPFIHYQFHPGRIGHFVFCIPSNKHIIILDGAKEPRYVDIQSYIDMEFNQGDFTILSQRVMKSNTISANNKFLRVFAGIAMEWIHDDSRLFDLNNEFVVSRLSMLSSKGGECSEKCIDVGLDCYDVVPCVLPTDCLGLPICDDDTQAELCHGESMFNCYYDIAHPCEPLRPKILICNGHCLKSPTMNLGLCGTRWLHDCYQSLWY